MTFLSELSINISFKCNFLCRHCSVLGSPMYNTSLDIQLIERAIKCAPPTVKMVVFTGGEPTLFPDKLTFGISLAKQRGMKTRVVTNAWWAKTKNKAKEFLLSIGRPDELAVSYDEFHEPWLSKLGGIDLIFNALSAAKELGITTHVLTDYKYADKFRGFADYVISGDPQAVGRAEEIRSVRAVKIHRGCIVAGDAITVLPDGSVTLCCGHILNLPSRRLITVGSLKEKCLNEIIEDMLTGSLMWKLRIDGPSKMLEEIGAPEAAWSCEACNILGAKYYGEVLKRWPKVGARKTDVPPP
ncbi:MAG: radical SAM protein [Thermoproteus sp.]|nr:radical SAM protein [Thermoproteus sp.]